LDPTNDELINNSTEIERFILNNLSIILQLQKNLILKQKRFEERQEILNVYVKKLFNLLQK